MCPAKALKTSRMKRTDPMNYPIHIGSLSTGERSNVSCRSVLTKSREGKALLEPTRHQSERRSKSAGCRKTNACKHRNGEPSLIADRDGKFGSRATVRLVKAAVVGEAIGNMHPTSRRCKRRRHAEKVFGCNWGDPVVFCTEGVKTTRVGACTVNLSQGIHGVCSPRLSGKQEQMQIIRGIRRNAESLGDVLQGVGDGHSSDEGAEEHKLAERRAISRRNVFEVVWSQ